MLRFTVKPGLLITIVTVSRKHIEVSYWPASAANDSNLHSCLSTGNGRVLKVV